MDPEKKSLNFIFPTKYVIPKSLKFSHWPSKVWRIFPTKTRGWTTARNVRPETFQWLAFLAESESL